jgi:CheY-like chemotaxis protein
LAFRRPLKNAPARLARLRAVQATSSAVQGIPWVLLAAPEDAERGLLAQALKACGYEVTIAETAVAALEALGASSGPPSAVVVDAAREGRAMFCTTLRQDAVAGATTLFVLGGRDGVAEALSALADDVLLRPAYAADIVALIQLEASPRRGDGACLVDGDETELPRLVRALLSGTRSGRIELPGGGRICFQRGRIVDAVLGPLQGRAALKQALLLTPGEYAVGFGATLAAANLWVGLAEYCDTLLPELTRWQRLVSEGLPEGVVLAFGAKVDSAPRGR